MADVPKKKSGPKANDRALSPVDRFLSKVDERKQLPAARGLHRLIFALDATASREPTWDLACSLHSELFDEAARHSQLAVQLCYYRGLDEFDNSRFSTTPTALLDLMQSVRCAAGRTQVKRVLAHALATARKFPLRAVVFIGDAFEEDTASVLALAGELKLRNVPVFVFQEGEDPRAARVFQRVAELTGGAHVPFSVDSADELRRLLGAVATFATAGTPGLEDFARSRGGRKALQLLQQLEKK